MTADEQQAALDLARQGDSQALGNLLESFRPYVRLIVRALRGRRLQARLDDSDLIQDALVEVHRHFPRFEGSTVEELVAWLRPIVLRSAGHTLRGHLETGKRDIGREQGEAGLEGAADKGSSPSAQVIRAEQTVQMAQALARLPDDMQQVLLGRHLDGLSYADLAQRLGRSEGAVRVLYTRALRRLREVCQEKLDPNQPEGDA
jgi:RNA polymerase sigma-70 factor (ECF subfamily)